MAALIVGAPSGTSTARSIEHASYPKVLKRGPATKAELPCDVVEHVSGKGRGSHGLSSVSVSVGDRLVHGARLNRFRG